MILTKLNNILFKIQTWFAVACLTVFFCGVAFQVFSRILGIPANFTEEVSNYAFIWVTFMGTALMLRENRHFRFTAIAAKFKGKLFWANEMICMLILLGISLLMLVHGAQLTQKFWTWHFTSLSSVSLGWAWLCLPLCGFTSTMYCIEAIYKFIRDPSSREIVDEATAAIREAELAEQQAGQTQNQKGGQR
ncbi:MULTISPECIES: TRAP transporter small permease [Anaerotruncus]|jgi:TRAP-type C4-dicarboxylate transport system permease small subunit|uniref:TRAP transporter small permease n=1 Tax=Anaerotruncus TaxID=244127 RepID=UPI0008361A68|nr:MULTISPECIES: TRAP transporter small permease [Anaerotruncus]RGX55522.1 TRAP transporter small permease [Anaerotruncus sp. AF02-27]